MEPLLVPFWSRGTSLHSVNERAASITGAQQFHWNYAELQLKGAGELVTTADFCRP